MEELNKVLIGPAEIIKGIAQNLNLNFVIILI